MRTFLILLIIGSANFFSAQTLLLPSSVTLESKYIENESSEVSWLMENAGKTIEIGKVTTEFKKLNKKDLLITNHGQNEAGAGTLGRFYYYQDLEFPAALSFVLQFYEKYVA